MEVREDEDVQSRHQDQQSLPTPSKQVKPSPNSVATNSVTLRLQKELMALMMSGGDLGVSAFPEGESIFTWIGTIQGGKGTMYEDLSYKLSLRFPVDYPFKPPKVKFETICFHPNVDHFGNICLDILQDKWSSAYDCRTILLSIQSLLAGTGENPFFTNPILRALLTPLQHRFGRTLKSTGKWCVSITWLGNHRTLDPLVS